MDVVRQETKTRHGASIKVLFRRTIGGTPEDRSHTWIRAREDEESVTKRILTSITESDVKERERKTKKKMSKVEF